MIAPHDIDGPSSCQTGSDWDSPVSKVTPTIFFICKTLKPKGTKNFESRNKMS